MKKIFYYTDVLPLLSRGEDALNKINRNLKVFKDASQDIKLVWHPWSRTEHYLELNGSELLKQYQDVLETYKYEGWGDLDESDTFAEAKAVLLGCNGYYGDVSDLVYEAQNAGIPVMLQNIDV